MKVRDGLTITRLCLKGCRNAGLAHIKHYDEDGEPWVEKVVVPSKLGKEFRYVSRVCQGSEIPGLIPKREYQVVENVYIDPITRTLRFAVRKAR